MVYVCDACNLSKGDLTLREFVKKKYLDMKSIEDILELLGKTF